MKQTTKNILGVAAIVLLSSGVAGLTTYKMLHKETLVASGNAFDDMFQQNPNVRLAAYNAVDAQPVDLTQAAESSIHAVVHI
ncbi:MAG: deoxyribonuclease HsdR, partial [Bacteroides sp.]|nr:deoxyribonuclease HsdR [Bacteroides sp.]